MNPQVGRRVGVLALQGAFARHRAVFDALGADTVEVRRADQLEGIDALTIPGGESGTMSMLLERGGLFEPISRLLDDGLPTFGTCAGMILLATGVSDGRSDQRSFAAVDIDVRRNAYGRQVDSFDRPVQLAPALSGGGTFDASFIRAPVVDRVGTDVDVLASDEARPVLCRQGPVLVASFHPELSDDERIHRYFLEEVS